MMSKKSILFVLLALVAAIPAQAAERLAVKATVNGPWTTYGLTVTTGAPNSIRAPLAARDGSLWWGLDEGAVRFDGANWTRYTAADGLIDGAVLSIVEDGEGTLWFSGSHQGKAAVARFDGQSWRIYSEADGLIGEWIGAAADVDTRGHL